LNYPAGAVSLTAIEGGEGAFAQPADYDSRGLLGGRIILASYSLEGDLKSGSQRVATVHFFAEDASAFENLRPSAVVFCNAAGESFQAEIKLLERGQ